VTVRDVELSVVRPLERLADPLRQVNVGGRRQDPTACLVEPHDAVQRVLDALVIGDIADGVDEFAGVLSYEVALDDDLARGDVVADPLARRARPREVTRLRFPPLPAATAEYCPATPASRALHVFTRALVRVMPRRIENPVPIAVNASGW